MDVGVDAGVDVGVDLDVDLVVDLGVDFISFAHSLSRPAVRPRLDQWPKSGPKLPKSSQNRPKTP